MPEFPLSHLRMEPRIGGPLPVEYVELCAWFYPQAGDGMMTLTRRQEDGTQESGIKEHQFKRSLAPLSADIEVPRMAGLWIAGVRRVTGWASLDQLRGHDYGPDSSGSR